jgi:hypothetical protein
MNLPNLKPLCLLITLFSSGAIYALEALEDDMMSEATGEGIAFLPENFSMVMRGADNTVDAGTGFVLDTDVTTNRAKDTGYVRFIPVGPLTSEAQDTNKDLVINASDLPVGKADIFVYGTAISQSNKNYGVARDNTDWNGRFGRNIDTWGTSANPWVLKLLTQSNVPDFNAPTPTSTSSADVSYFTLEAPLYNTNIGTLPLAEQSAYNLKFAYWLDAFVRDPNVVENMTATGTQFDVGVVGGVARANRLRLQTVWDGVSLNGSEVRLFQTLGGAATGVNGMSDFYNNTLGIAGVLRFNGGDSTGLRATVSTASSSRTSTGFVMDAAYGGGSTSINFSTAADQFRFRKQTVTDSVTGLTWTPPSVSSVLRLSTRETTDTALLSTPAINGGSAPTFDSAEGLHMYNPNINLVLGQLYQPLVLGVASDNKNLVLELARIANKETVYKQIYTNYADSNPLTNGGYFGSTCNVHQCGTTRTVGGVTYQGNSATHSSISIGSTEYNAATNTLTAYSGAEAVGISFGELQTRFQAGPFTTVRTEIEFQQRQGRTRTGVFTDTYLLVDPNITGGDTADPFGHPSGDCSGGVAGFPENCRRYFNRQGVHNDWQYLTAINSGTGVKTFGNTDGAALLNSTTSGASLFGTPMPGGAGASGTTNTPGAPFVRGLHDCPGGTGSTAQCNGESEADGARGAHGVGEIELSTPNNNRDWDLAGRNLPWFPTTGQAAFVYGQATDVIPATTTVSVNPSPLNNMGSAVIDGLLIQHLKITTKGL